jgi:hypothetical protein
MLTCEEKGHADLTKALILDIVLRALGDSCCQCSLPASADSVLCNDVRAATTD